MRLFIGNLPYTATKEDIAAVLADYGVSDIDMVRDKLTGRFRGYAFANFDEKPEGDFFIGIRRLFFGSANRSASD